MIKKPQNWENVQAMSDRAKLPLGAYVCKVLKATVESNQYGEQLLLGFDILEGEHKDYFRKEFNGNQYQNKKWKGILRLWLPKNNGDQKDEITKSILKGMVTSFEKSNPGYTFNWDEQSLVGKTVGIMFRNEEWENDEGKSGWAVRPFRAISVDSVRSGDFTLPKDKPLANKTSTGDANDTAFIGQNQGGYTPVDVDDELPF